MRVCVFVCVHLLSTVNIGTYLKDLKNKNLLEDVAH